MPAVQPDQAALVRMGVCVHAKSATPPGGQVHLIGEVELEESNQHKSEDQPALEQAQMFSTLRRQGINRARLRGEAMAHR